MIPSSTGTQQLSEAFMLERADRLERAASERAERQAERERAERAERAGERSVLMMRRGRAESAKNRQFGMTLWISANIPYAAIGPHTYLFEKEHFLVLQILVSFKDEVQGGCRFSMTLLGSWAPRTLNFILLYIYIREKWLL